MADYISILDKAVTGLAENTPANRTVIYDKARAAIERKLRAMDPAPSEDAIAGQLGQLESAIGTVEAKYAQPEPDAQPADTHPVPVSEPEAPAPPPVAEPEAAPPADDVQPVEAPTDEPAPESAPASPQVNRIIDDVILIDGIGDKTRSLLEEQGVTRLSQIVGMNDDALAALTATIGLPGFQQTQQWKAQAEEMLAGGLPRSKTDQARLEKMLEEGVGVAAPVTPAPAAMDEPTAVAAAPAQSPDTGLPGESEAASNAPATEMPGEGAAVSQPAPSPEPSVAAAPQAAPQSPAEPAPAAPAADLVTDAMDKAAADRASEKPAPLAGSSEPPPFVGELENDPQRAAVGDPHLERPVRVQPPKRGGAGKVIAGGSILLLLAGAAAGAYYYRDTVVEYGQKGVEAVRELLDSGQSEPATPVAAPETDSGTETQQDSTEASNGEKDTTRLNSDGTQSQEPLAEETEPVSEPANTETPAVQPEPETPAITTTEEEQPATVEVQEEASAENGSDTDGEPAAGESAQNEETAVVEQPIVINGENAYLYEEAAGTTGASRDEGSMVWSLVTEPPESGAEAEAVINGVLDIPARGLTMNLTIKRNLDAGLPATHIIELAFVAQPEFSGTNIDGVSRFVMKSTEQARGESLVGIPVRIDTGLFWIALNNLEQAQKTNLGLLENADWVDIPVSYVTGRRALLTFEKGATGKEVFAQALEDWKNR